MQKKDLRVKKTKLLIQNGFAKCISRKPFSKLTIHDLTNEMMINKSTFYKYYHDKYDLRDTLVHETLKSFAVYIDVSFLNPNEINSITNYRHKLPSALLPILHHKDWLTILWSDNLEMNVFSMMEETFANKFMTYISTIKKVSSKYDKLQANLFAASAMQTIKWWFYESSSSSTDEVAEIIIKCLQSGTYITFNK